MVDQHGYPTPKKYIYYSTTERQVRELFGIPSRAASDDLEEGNIKIQKNRADVGPNLPIFKYVS